MLSTRDSHESLADCCTLQSLTDLLFCSFSISRVTMKRVLNKSRKKQKPLRDVPRQDLSRQEMLDLLENMAITATITSQEAIPRGTSRPVPLPSFNLNDDGCEPAPLRNRVNEVCPACLNLDPTVDPDKMDFETHIWLRDNNGGHPMRRITALVAEVKESANKGCQSCFLICFGINSFCPDFFGSGGVVVFLFELATADNCSTGTA
jgi:hypothetical protein